MPTSVIDVSSLLAVYGLSLMLVMLAASVGGQDQADWGLGQNVEPLLSPGASRDFRWPSTFGCCL